MEILPPALAFSASRNKLFPFGKKMRLFALAKSAKR